MSLAPAPDTPPLPVPEVWPGHLESSTEGAHAGELAWQAYFTDPLLQMGRPETDAPHYSSWKDFAIRNRGKASTTDNTLTGPQTKLLGVLRKH
jgi:hypothetical protein